MGEAANIPVIGRARFGIAEGDDGAFEIVELKLVSVGSFADRQLAEVAVAALNGDPEASVVSEAIEASKPRRVETATDGATPAVEASGEWLPDELSEAFKRIEGGEPIKTVAEAFGKPWGSLRGKWAAAVKQAREAERMAAENDEDDAEECRLCGKTFKPTADRLDLCAKCDRDV